MTAPRVMFKLDTRYFNYTNEGSKYSSIQTGLNYGFGECLELE